MIFVMLIEKERKVVELYYMSIMITNTKCLIIIIIFLTIELKINKIKT